MKINELLAVRYPCIVHPRVKSCSFVFIPNVFAHSLSLSFGFIPRICVGTSKRYRYSVSVREAAGRFEAETSLMLSGNNALAERHSSHK